MKGKKSGTGVAVGTSVVYIALQLLGGADAKADLGKVDYWNASFQEGVGQKVDVTEKSPSGEYNDSSTKKLRIYGWGPTIGNPNDHAISPIGIDQNKACVLKIRLEADTTMSNNKDNAIDINWEGPEGGDPSYTPFDPNKRNFFMRQHPNSPSSIKDANVYDLLDLTNYFTENAQIWLPDITALTPRSPAQYDWWQKIVSNYADLSPSVFDGNLPDGKVNPRDLAAFTLYWLSADCNENNGWCKCADLDRDGNVNFIDYSLLAEQWLVDPNTIAKAIQFLPKEYREALDETARRILDYMGEHQQRLVCRVYNQKLPYHNLPGDMIEQLTARKEDGETIDQKTQSPDNNYDHQPIWARDQYSNNPAA